MHVHSRAHTRAQVVADVRMRQALLQGPLVSFETVVPPEAKGKGPATAYDPAKDRTFNLTSVPGVVEEGEDEVRCFLSLPRPYCTACAPVPSAGLGPPACACPQRACAPPHATRQGKRPLAHPCARPPAQVRAQEQARAMAQAAAHARSLAEVRAAAEARTAAEADMLRQQHSAAVAAAAAAAQEQAVAQAQAQAQLVEAGGGRGAEEGGVLATSVVPVPILPKLARMYISSKQTSAAKAPPPPPPTAHWLVHKRPHPLPEVSGIV